MQVPKVCIAVMSKMVSHLKDRKLEEGQPILLSQTCLHWGMDQEEVLQVVL